MTIETFIVWVSGLKLFLASAIGGFLSLNFFEKEKRADGSVIPMSALEKWLSVVGGTALGIFCAPAAVALAEVKEKMAEDVRLAAGILIAMFGISVASQIVKIIRQIKWDDIKARLPGGSK